MWLGHFTIILRLCLVILEWVLWAFGEVGVSLRGRRNIWQGWPATFRRRPTFRGRRAIWWRGSHTSKLGGTFGDVGVLLVLVDAAFGDADIGSTRNGILSFHVLSFSPAASSPPCAALWPAVLFAVVWRKAGPNYMIELPVWFRHFLARSDRFRDSHQICLSSWVTHLQPSFADYAPHCLHIYVMISPIQDTKVLPKHPWDWTRTSMLFHDEPGGFVPIAMPFWLQTKLQCGEAGPSHKLAN